MSEQEQRFNKAKAILEQLVDEMSLQTVTEALAEVCNEKEAHVTENWQDYDLAARWEVAQETLSKCAVDLSVLDL